jgi:hypothetical protein
MDKIIKITAGLFMVILVVFTAGIVYTGFVRHAYRTSLSSTYNFSWTITTDSSLSNVTLFIPLPADNSGNSPVVSRISSQGIRGIPGDWNVTLFDTGKATMAKITTPAIIPPAGTPPSRPFAIVFFIETRGKTGIDTLCPYENSAMFRPVRNLQQAVCPREITASRDAPRCSIYQTSFYADYDAPGNASVTVASALTGRNAWTVFTPASNEYTTAISAGITGSHHGWVTMNGSLTNAIGVYDAPGLPA